MSRIRPIAICLFTHNGRFLVFEGRDEKKPETFYRPLGGGIEFGEYSQDTIVREIREELGAEVSHLRYLGTLENIFFHDGGHGHEIVQVYDGEFADPAFYQQTMLIGHEDNGTPFEALWKSVADFTGQNAPPLYPNGLLQLIKAQKTT